MCSASCVAVTWLVGSYLVGYPIAYILVEWVGISMTIFRVAIISGTIILVVLYLLRRWYKKKKN